MTQNAQKEQKNDQKSAFLRSWFLWWTRMGIWGILGGGKEEGTWEWQDSRCWILDTR